MTTKTLAHNQVEFIKPFAEYSEVLAAFAYANYLIKEHRLDEIAPEGAEISETYDYHYTYRESDGCTVTSTEKFNNPLTAQQVEDYWGYFQMECNEAGYQLKSEPVEPLYVTVTYPHCKLPAHVLYERGIDEF